MLTKLTLRMNPLLIKRAKAYAKQHGTSVSQIVSDYFSLLNQSGDIKNMPSSKITNSLRGVLKGSNLDKKDFKTHLDDKYL
jgi:hypothetical protein